MAVLQRSFDELGTALADVTFCVLDLETTGADPANHLITEIGAVKVRGGEHLGSFHTLVNPGRAIPRQITLLTGITETMVGPAPPIDAVLPSLLEFVGGSVLVGHNFRFDLAFLGAALERTGRPRLGNRWADTCAMARRLVADEVPNCRLSTLASRLRLDHRPCHRALDDALATTDLLHLLLERAAGLGVLGLDDLLALPTMAGHPQAGKLGLTANLPRAPGVYLFRDAAGRALYVGKATNLRARVRSYFGGDERRKVGHLLRETQAVDHIRCENTLEAGVLEVRLIHDLAPRFNRQGTRWRSSVYVKLTLDERFPRLSVVRQIRDDQGLYLGPLASAHQARLVTDAIETAAPLRRCSARIPVRGTLRDGPCAPAQLGAATCPCAGTISEAGYREIVSHVVTGLRGRPGLLLDPLRRRMDALAAAERFEEAADVRDRAAALAAALRRHRRLIGLLATGRLELELQSGSRVTLRGGLLPPVAGVGEPEVDRTGQGVPLALADELACVGAWLDANAARVRLVGCDGELASPVPPLPRFEPAPPTSYADR